MTEQAVRVTGTRQEALVDFERTMRLTRAFEASGSGRTTDHLCHTAAALLDAMAASLTMADGPTFASATFALELEELQFTFGEGPGPDASHGSVVASPDLRAETRWPNFTPAARERGVEAVFAYPLGDGMGAMTVYRDLIGPLDEARGEEALVIARMVTIRLEKLGPAAMLDGASHDEYRAEVYQATGMVAQQLGIAPAAALARLRAHAYAIDERLLIVARRVADGTLRLDAHDGGAP
jgi:hypothetical protein